MSKSTRLDDVAHQCEVVVRQGSAGHVDARTKGDNLGKLWSVQDGVCERQRGRIDIHSSFQYLFAGGTIEAWVRRMKLEGM